MRYVLVILSFLLFYPTLSSAETRIGIGIAVPGLSIGINMPAYPRLAPIPGYPVYYDPYADSNYFFYDGMYWTLWGDNWYASSWYNGPWYMVEPDYVPLFILRIPVRYYRHPPAYFRGWNRNEPPRWGVHWGRGWEEHRRGWDKWDHRYVPRPAPLPSYQRNYTGNRYPHAIQQQNTLRSEHYRYEPRDSGTRRYFQQREQQRRPEQPNYPQQQRQIQRNQQRRPEQPNYPQQQRQIQRNQQQRQIQRNQQRQPPGRNQQQQEDKRRHQQQ
ncbi:MAG: hypothetical protein KGI54_10310 [Pseudomonadota bacterium]|nr:hypothetical protein [Pseudomonadota bacterium]